MARHSRLGDRLQMALIGIVMGAFSGWGMSIVFETSYPKLSSVQHYFLWATAIVSVLGTIISLEILLAHKKASGEWYRHEEDVPSTEKSDSKSKQILLGSIARVVLASLLAGLPVIAQGAFGVIVFGFLLGLSLEAFVSGVANRLAPIKKDDQSGQWRSR